jgi:hypothetical protein
MNLTPYFAEKNKARDAGLSFAGLSSPAYAG